MQGYLSMKKLYITDLDHTFLRTDQSVSDFSTKVWNEKAKESILSVATARSFQKTHDFLDTLHLHAPMILLDGTMIVAPDKTLIDVKTVNKALGDAIIEEGAKYGIYPFVIALKDMDLNEALFVSYYFKQSSAWRAWKTIEMIHVWWECKDKRAMEMNLKLVYFGEYNTLSPLTKHMERTFGKELEYKLSPEKYSNGWFLTILHPEGDKAHALQKVLDYMGKETEDVTVFGDSVNDIGMFKLAGTSVAVSNALDEVKAVADIVLPHSNDEDGVAKYLEKIIS